MKYVHFEKIENAISIIEEQVKKREPISNLKWCLITLWDIRGKIGRIEGMIESRYRDEVEVYNPPPTSQNPPTQDEK